MHPTAQQLDYRVLLLHPGRIAGEKIQHQRPYPGGIESRAQRRYALDSPRDRPQEEFLMADQFYGSCRQTRLYDRNRLLVRIEHQDEKPLAVAGGVSRQNPKSWDLRCRYTGQRSQEFYKGILGG